jgi:hypothetical protein
LIKTQYKILTGIILIGVMASGIYFLGSTDKISKDKFVEKYNSVAEIKAKYQIDGASLKKTVSNNTEDAVRVTLGDKNAQEFIPSLTISKWAEVFLKIEPKLENIASNDKNLNFNGDKVEFSTPKVNYGLYETPTNDKNSGESFEYDITLKGKPATNKIEFNIKTQGLDFFFQPPLNQEIKIGEEGVVSCTETDCYNKDGKVIIYRPENVVGSYAIYASGEKVNLTDGKLYKTGKVGQIFRPRIADAEGKWAWEELSIKDNLLTITIPQDFLDKAVYPIHSTGINFGDTTLGSTGSSVGYYGPYRSQFTTGSVGGVGVSMTVGVWDQYGVPLNNITTQCAIYSGANLITNGTTNQAVITFTVVPSWTSPFLFSTGPTIAANTAYYLAFGANTSAQDAFFVYDTATGGVHGYDITAYASWWPTWVDNGGGTRKYSIYATYNTVTSNFFLLF